MKTIFIVYEAWPYEQPQVHKVFERLIDAEKYCFDNNCDDMVVYDLPSYTYKEVELILALD